MKKELIKRKKHLIVSSIRILIFLTALITILYFSDGQPGNGFVILLIMLLLLVGETYYLYFNNKNNRRTIKNLEFFLDSKNSYMLKNSMLNYPQPFVVTTMNGSIEWYNESFKYLMHKKDVSKMLIQDLIPGIQLSRFIENKSESIDDICIGEKIFEVFGENTEGNPDNSIDGMIMLYFVDKTEEVKISELREGERVVECIVLIDNYDEVLKETPDSNHGKLIGEIEARVGEWILSGGGVFRKCDRDRFIVLFENKNFSKILESKFDVLNKIREINLENKIPVTISIGIGKSENGIEESDKFARLAIDMALGRGGDQAVIKDSASFSFYGAKTREVEKKTKVKARVVAHALRELIDQSSRVFIMGHKNGDMDSLGSAIGIYRAVKNRKKRVNIVIDKININAKNLLNEFEKMEDYENTFVSGDQAMNMYEDDALLIIVDTHRPSIVEYPELIDVIRDIVLIDHHRRSEDFIENSVLSYHEPYASSTSEMVTEILQYIQENERISVKEAEALYAGIFMDTKGFNVKTGVRTFEAASYLRRMGVDTVAVRRLFRCDFDMYIKKVETISAAHFYRDNIAISFFKGEHKDMQIIVAQAADELLDIAGIEASFVLAAIGNRIIISGRSLDEINVQVILEKLGGGGHITIAGAQLSDVSIETAEKMLMTAIDEFLSES